MTVAVGEQIFELAPASAEMSRVERLEKELDDARIARDWPRANGITQALVVATNSHQGWPRLGAAEIFGELPPIPWLLEALDIAPGPPTMIAGYGFSAKTLAAQQAALAVATGGKWWDRWPVNQGRVLHIDYEQGARLTRERYQRLARAAGAAAEDLDGWLSVATYPPTYLDAQGAENIYARELEGHTLAIVDSLRAAAPTTDENESSVRRTLDMLARVSERTGCTVVVIHHARKPNVSAAGGAKMSIRGSGALFDACASVLVLDGSERGAPISASHEKARITGRLHPPFVMNVEDVPSDDDERWGLRITTDDARANAEQRHEAELDALTDHVLKVVRNNPGSTTRTICELAHRRYGKVVAALEILERGGALANTAQGKRAAEWRPTTNRGVTS